VRFTKEREMNNKINTPYLLTPGGSRRTALTEEAAPEAEVAGEEKVTEEVITEEVIQEVYHNTYDKVMENLTQEEVETLIMEYVDALTLQTLSEEYGIEVEEVEE